jgi:5-methylthioadenosine/S-adenosylhomocysteine deaminase
MTTNADLLILGGLVLTVDDADTVWRDGGLAIRDGALVAVGSRTEIEAAYTAPSSLNATGRLIMPGLINAHTHAPMTVYRGLGDDLPLDSWLKEYIWPAEARTVNAEMVYWGTLLAACEMIRAGMVLFSDMYFFEDDIGRAARDVGMRAVLGEALVDFPSPNTKTPAAGLAYVRDSFQRWEGDSLVRVSLQPHSCYACSADLLLQCKELADEFGAIVLTHAAETAQEIEDVVARTGDRPVPFLDRLGLLDDRMVLAHGVHVNQDEIALLAERGSHVSHNPQSNMKLASGVAPVPDLLAAGVNVALATDGAASNNDLSLWAEMQTAALLHKVHTGDPTVLPARTVVRMATRGGAQAMGMGDLLGSLEPGKRADVVVLDLDRPHLVPMYDPYSHLVYAAGPSDVRTVLIEGRFVLKDREILRVDEAEVMARVRQMAIELGQHWGHDAYWRRSAGQ